MAYYFLACPSCGSKVKAFQNPLPTVDIIMEFPEGILLIKRKNEPHGWALPGGFVDYGETLEAAAIREAEEETSLCISNLRLVGCYSDPRRDPRQHTISTVFFAANVLGIPRAGDDAADIAFFPPDSLPQPLCFDHHGIILDYIDRKKKGLL